MRAQAEKGHTVRLAHDTKQIWEEWKKIVRMGYIYWQASFFIILSVFHLFAEQEKRGRKEKHPNEYNQIGKDMQAYNI